MDRRKSLNVTRTQIYLSLIIFSSLITCTVLSLSRRPSSLQDPIRISNHDNETKSRSDGRNSSLIALLLQSPNSKIDELPGHSSSPPPFDRTARIVLALQRHYHDSCDRALTSDEILNQGMISQIESSDEFSGVLIGTEMWNRLSLDELDDPFRFYADPTDSDSDAFPFAILSYGKRLQQGKALLARMGADRVDCVSYPSLEKAFADLPYLSRYLFRDAAMMNWDNFTMEFSGKNHGYLLSTLNQWMIFERLANGTYPDQVVIVEDDMFLVPDFTRKFRALRSQLATVPWDVVFLGTCFGIRSYTPATPNLYVADRSRCFNAVLMKASVAVKILEAGVCVDRFAAVDHLFNRYIVDLNLNAYYVYPPLAYEQSKNVIQHPC